MQNERTWCVSRAKPIPVWLNMWRITTKPIWCMALVTIYLEGLVLYLLMQYERGHTGYMKKDYHYCVLMMAMSAFAGMPHITYRPKSKRMSLFFGLMLITGILISTAWNCFLIKVLTSPIYNAQISTISELMEHDYRLVGSYNGKEFMMQQPSKVSKRLNTFLLNPPILILVISVSRRQIVLWLRRCSIIAGKIAMEW